MPTNLPAEAQAKLAEYQAARTIESKIRVLEEALSLIPDHKGTEKLRRQLKKRLAELRREADERRSKRVGGHNPFSVEKVGWAQISLIGPANSGKSSLLNALTNASSPVSDYPLTTQRPVPGMMIYENAEIQLVDLPAVLTEGLEETSYASRSLGVARNSDLMAIVIDSSGDPYRHLEVLIDLLEEYRISIKPRRCVVEVEKKDSGGLRIVVLGNLKCSYDEVRSLLLELGLKSAVVKIMGDAGLSDIEEQLIRGATFKRALVLLNKCELINGEELEGFINYAASLELKAIPVSASRKINIDLAKEALFKSLGLIRVYTQKDGRPSPKPILIRQGATVKQVAELIHGELASKMRYAKVWGKSVKVQGQRVGPEHTLHDLDLIEIGFR